jgi:hypothetical protein
MSTDTSMQLGMIGTAMQAITVRDRAAGVGGLSLTDMPYPHAAENDVIVRVYAAGFTPGELDWPGTWTDRTTGLTVGQRVFGLADWTRNVRGIRPRPARPRQDDHPDRTRGNRRKVTMTHDP